MTGTCKDATMKEREITFRAVPDSEIDPQIAAVLKPGERVYWQAQPGKGGIPPMLIFLVIFGIIAAWVEGVRDLQAVEALLGESLATLKRFWQQLPWAFALFALLPIGLVIGFWPRQERYALSDQRVLQLRSGEIIEQARPEQLMLRKSISIKITIGKRSKTGDVRWANIETYERNQHMDRRSYMYFKNIRDPDKVTRMLEAWQRQWLDARDEAAAASAESFRQATAEPDTATGPAPGAQHGSLPPARGTQRIVHPRYGFSVDVPSAWDVEVQHNYDGPLRIFGITLLKRIIRPGTPRRWDLQDDRPWNLMTLVGGTSTRLNISVKPGTGDSMPTEQEVLDDRWGKLLGVRVKFFEKDIEINGFRGFAAVRELPAGVSNMGLAKLPTDVISRQWWLTGHGLDFEIQGMAPQNSTALQETLDLVVGSLRIDLKD